MPSSCSSPWFLTSDHPGLEETAASVRSVRSQFDALLFNAHGYPHQLMGMMRYTMEIFGDSFFLLEWGGRRGANRNIVYPFLAGLLSSAPSLPVGAKLDKDIRNK